MDEDLLTPWYPASRPAPPTKEQRSQVEQFLHGPSPRIQVIPLFQWVEPGVDTEEGNLPRQQLTVEQPHPVVFSSWHERLLMIPPHPDLTGEERLRLEFSSDGGHFSSVDPPAAHSLSGLPVVPVPQFSLQGTVEELNRALTGLCFHPRVIPTEIPEEFSFTVTAQFRGIPSAPASHSAWSASGCPPDDPIQARFDWLHQELLLKLGELRTGQLDRWGQFEQVVTVQIAVQSPASLSPWLTSLWNQLEGPDAFRGGRHRREVGRGFLWPSFSQRTDTNPAEPNPN